MPVSNHYAPHTGTTFEGYYSKFRLPSGASIALIISTVPAVAPVADHPNVDIFLSLSSIASSVTSLLSTKDTSNVKKGAPYLIVFAYVSADGRKWYLKEWTPEHMTQTRPGGGKGFEWAWANGRMRWDGAEQISWDLDYPEVKFNSSIEATEEGSVRTPWDPSFATSTPAGFLADLPLPIQWHVHSTESACAFKLSLTAGGSYDPSREPSLAKSDQAGIAHVHAEKNWAHSFPSAYIWIQSRDHAAKSGICIAGGSLIPGVEAFLVGYTAKNGRFISFKPPTSTSIFSLSLGLTTDISYPTRKAELDFKGWFTRLKVVATAPEETFFPLSAPLNTGHSEGYTVQSFGADVEVKVYRRTWWGSWEETADGDKWNGGSLEFGGDYYRPHMD
jgi:tocopherol cyclase